MERINKSSSVNITPYRLIPEKEHVIVEQLLTGEFYELPRPALEALDALSKGITPEHIEIDLINKYPDEEINMVDFLAQLEDMGFLADDEAESYSKYEFEAIKADVAVSGSTLSKVVFHNKVIPVYAILLCANIVFFISRPDVFPLPRDLFPLNSMVLNIIISLLVSLILLAIHESGHVMAARAYGIKSSVRVGHRLFMPVIETQMPTIWRIPRGRRNIPLLAGLFMDHTVLFISLCILIFIPTLSVTVAGLLGLIILQLVMMSLYQCMFFMKTDLYYLIQNVSGSYNLLENAEGWLKGKLPFVRSQNSTVIYEKERDMVRGYAIFYILGLLSSAMIFIFYAIPQLIYSFTISFERLIHSSPLTTKADAIVFFAQFIIYAGLLLYSWSKKVISK